MIVLFPVQRGGIKCGGNTNDINNICSGQYKLPLSYVSWRGRHDERSAQCTDSRRWTDKACETAALNLVIIGVLRSDQIYYLLSICKTNNGYRTDSNVIPDGMEMSYQMEWECHTYVVWKCHTRWNGNVIPDGMGMSYLCGMEMSYQMQWESHTRWNGNVIPDEMGISYQMEWESHTCGIGISYQMEWESHTCGMGISYLWYGNLIPDGMGIPYHIGMVGMESYHTIEMEPYLHTMVIRQK